MRAKSIRFASWAALVLLAGCHSSPPKPAKAPAPVAATPQPSSGTTAASPPGGPAPAPAKGAPSASAAPGATKGAPAAAPAPPPAPIPERAAQQYAQAVGMMKAGRTTDAEVQFKQLAAAYPTYAGPDVNLGLIYVHAQRYGDAEAAFNEALKRNPDNAIANDELGIVERKLGKFTEAEAAYQRTIAIEPNYAPAYLNLGVLYDLYLAQPQKALEQFEHYLSLAGENKQVAGWVIELKKRVGAPATPAAAPAKKEPSV